MTTVTLSKPQTRRLRLYFSRGARADVSSLDGTDLDLVGFGMLEIAHISSWATRVVVTQAGLNVLHSCRQADITKRNVHHELGSRLAHYLRERGRVTWENIEFKNMVTESSGEDGGYSHWKLLRPDVFSILPTLNILTANPCVHEIKVSRADFLSDIANENKRVGYSKIAEAVYYVAPEGIIKETEVPVGFGLLVERALGDFVLVRRPKKKAVSLEPHHYLNLILKHGDMPASS